MLRPSVEHTLNQYMVLYMMDQYINQYMVRIFAFVEMERKFSKLTYAENQRQKRHRDKSIEGYVHFCKPSNPITEV